MTTKQEKKYITQQLTSTFSTSHLPASVLEKAATTGGQLAQRFGTAVVMSNSAPPQQGKRLHEISDDSGEENEYRDDAPPRKRARFHGPDTGAEKSSKQYGTRSRAPKQPRLPRPPRPSKKKLNH